MDERKAGVTVPAAALRHGPRGDFVWVVSHEQKAELRTVTAGQAIDGRVLIERGLKPGEQVVTDGHFRLEAGSRSRDHRAASRTRRATRNG